jgi:predicted nucleic acid-binding protein
MIILNTNVLTAFMQQQPGSGVVGWLDAQPAESIWISGITLFENVHGLAWLPDGQRKATLRARF